MTACFHESFTCRSHWKPGHAFVWGIRHKDLLIKKNYEKSDPVNFPCITQLTAFLLQANNESSVSVLFSCTLRAWTLYSVVTENAYLHSYFITSLCTLIHTIAVDLFAFFPELLNLFRHVIWHLISICYFLIVIFSLLRNRTVDRRRKDLQHRSPALPTQLNQHPISYFYWDFIHKHRPWSTWGGLMRL